MQCHCNVLLCYCLCYYEQQPGRQECSVIVMYCSIIVCVIMTTRQGGGGVGCQDVSWDPIQLSMLATGYSLLAVK